MGTTSRVSYSRRAPHAKTRRRTIVGTFLTRTFTVEGANIEILYRYAETHYDRSTALAAELVRRGVAVIFATGKAAGAHAAKVVTAAIPIVFVTDADPVEFGLVGRLSPPGANVTA